jgi:hypothetical protein
LEVRVLDLIEVFDRVYFDENHAPHSHPQTPKFHFVIVDYLCERISGEPRAGSDVTHVAYAREDELEEYALTETATRVLKKAFAMERLRSGVPTRPDPDFEAS